MIILAAQVVSSVLRCFDFTGHENDQNLTRTSQKRKGNKGQRTSDCDGRMTKTASMMTANISEISDPNKKAKNWNTSYTEPKYFLVNMHVWWAGPHWNLWHWYDWYVKRALAAQAGTVPPMVTAGFALKILRSLGERERCAAVMPAVMPAGEK